MKEEIKEAIEEVKEKVESVLTQKLNNAIRLLLEKISHEFNVTVEELKEKEITIKDGKVTIK